MATYEIKNFEIHIENEEDSKRWIDDELKKIGGEYDDGVDILSNLTILVQHQLGIWFGFMPEDTTKKEN